MSIHHDIQFSCSNEHLFEALTSSERFAEFSGSPARIDAVRGGEFSCFGNLITGITVDIVRNQRLVQAWRVFSWEDGVYSIAKFELRQISRTETKLIFDHIGFPEGDREHLASGWSEKYWKPMKAMLESSSESES